MVLYNITNTQVGIFLDIIVSRFFMLHIQRLRKEIEKYEMYNLSFYCMIQSLQCQATPAQGNKGPEDKGQWPDSA
jgi:hypothetical protein